MNAARLHIHFPKNHLICERANRCTWIGEKSGKWSPTPSVPVRETVHRAHGMSSVLLWLLSIWIKAAQYTVRSVWKRPKGCSPQTSQEGLWIKWDTKWESWHWKKKKKQRLTHVIIEFLKASIRWLNGNYCIPAKQILQCLWRWLLVLTVTSPPLVALA